MYFDLRYRRYNRRYKHLAWFRILGGEFRNGNISK
jgi:hypothetical protein